LKRALAFSEEERIGWIELFDTFGYGVTNEKNLEDTEPKNPIIMPTKDKQRAISTNPAIGLSPNLTSHSPTPSTPWEPEKVTNGKSALNIAPPPSYNHITPPPQTSSPLINMGGLSSPYSTNTMIQPPPKPNYYSSNSYLRKGETYPPDTNHTSTTKKSAQVESAIQWRQCLIYFNFYCIEMLTHYTYIQSITNKP
jgi:hypothetical protein